MKSQSGGFHLGEEVLHEVARGICPEIGQARTVPKAATTLAADRKIPKPSHFVLQMRGFDKQ